MVQYRVRSYGDWRERLALVFLRSSSSYDPGSASETTRSLAFSPLRDGLVKRSASAAMGALNERTGHDTGDSRRWRRSEFVRERHEVQVANAADGPQSTPISII